MWIYVLSDIKWVWGHYIWYQRTNAVYGKFRFIWYEVDSTELSLGMDDKEIRTRPTLIRRQTLGRLRSIYPDMNNHFASQSQTCQLLKIIFSSNIDRTLWKVVQSQVELIKINFKFEAPTLWVYLYIYIYRERERESSWQQIVAIPPSVYRNLPDGR